MSRRYSASPAEAEDAAQEIFISLWKSAHRYDPTRASEAAFVATIARRRLIDRLRARGRRAPTVPLEEGEVVSGDGAARGDAALDVMRVREAMERLDEQPRRLLEMAVLEGFSHAQIAERTGIALGTVKSHVRRSLIKVRQSLGARGAGR